MDDRQTEVHHWLESVYGGSTVPPYELNTKTTGMQ